MFREVGPELDISMTTNGVLLDRLAEPLAEAGAGPRDGLAATRCMRHRFAEMTRRDALDRVLAGIEAAEDAGLTPDQDQLRGDRRDERRRGRRVRRAGRARPATRSGSSSTCRSTREHEWERAKVVPSAQDPRGDRRRLPAGRPKATAPSRRRATGSPTARRAAIGVIASVTEPFCDTCNRLRMTAEGQVRACLFALEETDLRGPLRAGASDDELVAPDPRERVAQVVGPPDQPSGLRAARRSRCP